MVLIHVRDVGDSDQSGDGKHEFRIYLKGSR